jgi:hypothetical protein
MINRVYAYTKMVHDKTDSIKTRVTKGRKTGKKNFDEIVIHI